jgi:hypothetical protein
MGFKQIYKAPHLLLIAETDADVTKHTVLLLYVYLLSVSFTTSLIVSHRWQHICTFVSAVDVSDSCTERIKEFRNHIETVKHIN